jgi:hypothetical protein
MMHKFIFLYYAIMATVAKFGTYSTGRVPNETRGGTGRLSTKS